MEREKFKIGEKGSIEENIERLQRELDETFAVSKGAPKIKEDSTGAKKEDKKPVLEKVPEAAKQDRKIPKKTHVHGYGYSNSSKESFNLFKTSKFYITFFSIAAFVIIIFKAPVFKYTTPFRPDNDLPQIEVGFKYYNNIFGKQTRSETIINVGKEKITVRLPMSEWINLSKEKKLLILKYI